MQNEYEIRGDVTAIFINHKKKIIETIIDTADLPRAKSYENSWIPSVARNGSVYVNIILYTENGKKKVLKLHRMLMNAPKGLVVDHINHDTLDNRRSTNLRNCTNAENCQNYDKARKTSKSGVLGVYYKEQNKRWVATICKKGCKRYSKCFKTFEEAKEAITRMRAEHLPYSQEALNSVATTKPLNDMVVM
jgi:hypothetical protein